MMKENERIMMTEWIRLLKNIFMTVRLVDVNENTEYSVDAEGRLKEGKNKCFEVWGKNQRCANCISAQAYRKKGQLEKFEFIGDEVFYVISKYIEWDGRPYMLELVNRVDGKSFMGSVDRHLFVKQIQEYDRKLYMDALTGAYNRLYYQEQLSALDSVSAIAMLDLDRFKSINDCFGHLCGDEALRCVAQTILSSIRSTDALIRYGGDEFLIVFTKMPEEAFRTKLEKIRQMIGESRPEHYPEAQITVSIGGMMTSTCTEEVIRQLDVKLYEAKSGRNRVVV